MPQATVEDAIRTGLAENSLETGSSLGIDLTDYRVGPSVHVQSLVHGYASYELVQLLVGDSTRAIALVDATGGGYVFGAIAPVFKVPAFMSSQGRSEALAAVGMRDTGELVWAPTAAEATLPFVPIIRGADARSGRPAFLTVHGRTDSLTFEPQE